MHSTLILREFLKNVNGVRTYFKILGVLCVIGIFFVGSGMYLDDVSYWFVADMYFISTFFLAAILFFVASRGNKIE